MDVFNFSWVKVYSFKFWYLGNSNCGSVHVIGEEVEESKYDVTMQLYARKLDKKDFFGKVAIYNDVVYRPSDLK